MVLTSTALTDASMADIAADIRVVSEFARKLGERVQTIASVSTVEPAKLRTYLERQTADIAALLEESVNARYLTDIGVIHGALIDRALVTVQAALVRTVKERNARGFEELTAEVERIMKILGSMIELVPAE